MMYHPLKNGCQLRKAPYPTKPPFQAQSVARRNSAAAAKGRRQHYYDRAPISFVASNINLSQGAWAGPRGHFGMTKSSTLRTDPRMSAHVAATLVRQIGLALLLTTAAAAQSGE